MNPCISVRIHYDCWIRLLLKSLNYWASASLEGVGTQMLYTCIRGHNGHQSASNECASATTLNPRTRCRWDSLSDSSRAARARASAAAGGTGQAVRTQPGPGAGSSAAVGGRGTG